MFRTSDHNSILVYISKGLWKNFIKLYLEKKPMFVKKQSNAIRVQSATVKNTV